MAVINNVAYSWSMVRLTSAVLGWSDTDVTLGVSALKWNKSRKMENNYGLGGNPISRGFGNREYSASLTMDYDTASAIRSAAGGTLLNVGEFDLVVSFANAYAGSDWKAQTVTLAGCVFTEDGMDTKQDDTSITHEYDLHPFKITMSGSSTDDFL